MIHPRRVSAEERGSLTNAPPFLLAPSNGHVYKGCDHKYHTHKYQGIDTGSAGGRELILQKLVADWDLIDLLKGQGTTQVGKHSVCNTTAVGGDVWTDMEWGGSIVTVAAGQSVTLVITYDENTERGAVTNLVIFIDAMRGDSNTYNSDITLSGMSFS